MNETRNCKTNMIQRSCFLLFTFLISGAVNGWLYAQEPVKRWGYYPGAEGGVVLLAGSAVQKQNLRFGDFDGDGKTDVFTKIGNRWKYSSTGRNAWKDLAESNVALSDLRFGYFDNDKKTDIFAKFGNRWRYSSAGASAWKDLAESNVALSDLRFGDFDGDGKTDVFTKIGNRWKYSSAGRSAWKDLAESNVALSDLRFGNFDNDSRTDVFAKFGKRWRYSSAGTSAWINLAESDVALKDLHFGNFDGDAKTDVLTYFGNSWYYSSGGRKAWQRLRRAGGGPEVPFTNGSGVTYAMGDFDGDGKADIFDSSLFDAQIDNLQPNPNRNLRFLVTADPQYVNDPDNTQYPDRRRTHDTANSTMRAIGDLLGSSANYKGVIIAGDLTQTTWQEELKYYQNAIASFKAKVYAGFGNHDLNVSPFTLADTASVMKAIKRSTLPFFSPWLPFPHYSWNWDDVHFVQLNLYPGDDEIPTSTNDEGRTDYLNPFFSLSFLKDDLALHVGNSGRPVVLIHHYGIDGFSRCEHCPSHDDICSNCWNNTDFDGPAPWWSADMRKRYWDAIADYNVIAIFTGHWHNPVTSNAWVVKWSRPNGGRTRSYSPADTLDNFVSGAAVEGLFLDVSISGDTMTINPQGTQRRGANIFRKRFQSRPTN